MKTLLMALGLLVIGCGKEESSPATQSSDLALTEINTRAYSSTDYSFNLAGIPFTSFETEGSQNYQAILKYFSTAPKTTFYMKKADGSLLDCEAKVFIGYVKNYKGTNKPYASLLFERVDMSKTAAQYNPCQLYGTERKFSFKGSEILLEKI